MYLALHEASPGGHFREPGGLFVDTAVSKLPRRGQQRACGWWSTAGSARRMRRFVDRTRRHI
ncbi:hypothetical protein ACPA9J_30360 [Pseudomonas aeruginosa]